jgi:hypothetical protein
MPTTTNYGWTTPADTDLVKDGASAIRTLGTAIDTTTKNLNPSTTLGDIEYRSSTANTNTRLPLGTAGQVLTVNSGATAPEWAAVASGGMTLLDTLTLSGTSVTSTTFSSAYEQLIIYMKKAYISAGSNDIVFRLNADTGSNYAYSGNRVTTTTNTGVGSSSATSFAFGVIGNKTTDIEKNYAIINLMRPKDTDAVYVQATSMGFDENAVRYSQRTSGIYDSSAAITSFTIFTPSSDTFSGGNVYIYGVK